MDPFRNNTAVDLAKASTLYNNPSSTTTNRHPSHIDVYLNDMPAPPAYHSVVDPNMPIPNITNPYDPQEEDCDPNSLENTDDTPEITINAATQIRGHGNIISIAQMDSVRIANLISSVLAGEITETSKTGGDDAGARPPTPTSPPLSSATAMPQRERTSTTQVRGVKRYSNINITVNCGATIIGDRNVVGPGLGDIARQMQMAQRNQAALLAQQQAAAAATGQAQKVPFPPLQQRNISPGGVVFPVKPATTAMGVATPPMSRSSSLNSDTSGKKRKAGGEDGGEGVAGKRRC